MKLIRDEHGQAGAELILLLGFIILAVLFALALLGAFFKGVTLTNAHSQAEVRGNFNLGTQHLAT
jgi:Flp pilus assembly pilin Flp